MTKKTMVRAVVLFAAVVAVAGTVFFVARLRPADPLARIDLHHRRIQARLSAFGYLPLRVFRGSEQPVSNASVSEVLDELRKRIGTSRSPGDLHRLALVELAAGKTTGSDALLAEAMHDEPGDAAMLSDRAVAEFAAGRIADAAEWSARALQRDPTFQPAAFNWALCLGLLSNRIAAIDAWEKYLRLDSSSGWAAEARDQLAQLRRPRPEWQRDQEILSTTTDQAKIRQIVDRYPQRTRSWVQNELLPRWIERRSPTDFALLHTIAAARSSSGDSLLLDVLEHAAADPSAVADAFRSFATAQKAVTARDLDSAAVSFAAAAQLFSKAGSPMSFVAEISAASSDFYGGRGDAALARLDALDGRIPDRYPIAAAESKWVRGLVMGQRGQWNDSLLAFRSALQAAKRARETEHEVSLSALIASLLDRIGEPEEAEQVRIEILRRLDEINASPQRVYVAFAETTWAALSAGRPRLALVFIESLLQIAEREGKDSLFLAETEAKHALALRDIGQLAAAGSACDAARAHAIAIKTQGLRDRTLAQIDYIRGTLEVGVHPSRAIESISSAVDLWARYDWKLHAAAARTLRGEARLRTGDREGAELDFRASIEQMERERGALDEPFLRVAYFERADRVFERLIELLLDENRVDDALTIAERKRARTLLDQLASRSGDAAVPMSAREIAKRIDPSATVVAYSLLDRQVAIWVIRRNEVAFARTSVSRQEIEGSATRCLAAIAGDDVAAIQKEGRWLFDRLVAPVASRLDPASPLVFIPDGALRTFPFAALVMENGQFLIERYRVATAPSATIFARSAGRAAHSSSSVLSVAEPAPPGADRLPSAAREVEESARLYLRGRTFIGTEITPEEFLAEARHVDVVYFAGHAQLDAKQPSHSALMFEPRNENGQSALTASAVAANDLPTRPLVILGACSTGRGKTRRVEGVDSLATAFLHAGARGVVATLWDIEDSASSQLFRSLHQNLRKGARAADALRDAQLAMLHGSRSSNRAPSAWASTVVIGSL